MPVNKRIIKSPAKPRPDSLAVPTSQTKGNPPALFTPEAGEIKSELKQVIMPFHEEKCPCRNCEIAWGKADIMVLQLIQPLIEQARKEEREKLEAVKTFLIMVDRDTILTDDEGLQYREVDEGQIQALKASVEGK